ncbi:MAG: head GIN domain-containing protein [Saprospiraceae bacterium]
MRNLLIFMLLVAVFVLGKRSCNGTHFSFGGVSGKGPIQTETRNVQGFHGIDLGIAGNVEVTVGENYSVEISAQQNLLPLLKTELREGALHIFSEENLNSSEGIVIRVTAPSFDEFSVSGSGTIRVNSAVRSEKMAMNVAGSGEIYCAQSDFGSLSTNIGGSGTIELGGEANDMESDIAGSGDIKAKSLTVNTLKVSISGSGTVTADVISNLDASISGSGDVFYSGSPAVETSISGSGKVKKIAVQ